MVDLLEPHRGARARARCWAWTLSVRPPAAWNDVCWESEHAHGCAHLAFAVVLLGVVQILHGAMLHEVFLGSVALAVAVIPEGLPVAMTVALAIAVRRMSARKVIARRLAAVEALGSCTCIASDKTGTLTLNELTVQRVLLPGQAAWGVTGQG